MTPTHKLGDCPPETSKEASKMDSRKRTLDKANVDVASNGMRRRKTASSEEKTSRHEVAAKTSSSYSAHNVDHQTVVPLSMQGTSFLIIYLQGSSPK